MSDKYKDETPLERRKRIRDEAVNKHKNNSNPETVNLNENLTEASLTSDETAKIISTNELLEILVDGTNEIFFDESQKALQVINNELVEYCLAVVPPHLIKEFTIVASENNRNQQALNEHNLEYILKTLRLKGQYFPAKGFISDGIITVVDGSSRRESCILAKKPFKVWVTKTILSSEVIDELSTVSNDTKTFSFYEQSLKHIKGHRISGKEIKEYCDSVGLKNSRFSLMASVLNIDNYVWGLFPSSTSVPRRIIEKLVPLWNRLETVDLSRELIDNLKDSNEEFETDDEALDYILLCGKTSLPDINTNALKGFDHRANFAIKESYDAKNSEMRIVLKNIDEETCKKVSELLKGSM